MNKRALMLSAATVALLTGSALADTDVTKQLTSPIDTQTDGNITIESDGSVIVTANPPTAAAVTINSNAIVNNEGLISYNGVDAATGVKLQTGVTGEYEQTGTLDLTGTGTGKTGIAIAGPSGNPNSGTFTGVIPAGGGSPIAINLESGATISVRGDTSIGINQLSGTNLVGDIDLDGTLSVIPTSGTSTKTSLGNVIAIDLAGTMTGNLNIGTNGIVAASGQGAEGIQTLQQITGSIINNGTIEAIGTSNTNINPNVAQPEAGTALGIGNSVTGGIYNAGPATTSDTTTARATISTQGNAPAVLINPTIGNASPTTNLTIGPYNDATDPGYSFLNRGTISGSSATAGVNVTGVSIVGASQTVQTILSGGMFNGGSISATATTNTKVQSAIADALVVGNYATFGTNGLVNSNESNLGTISASVSGPESGTASAITIQQFGDLASINNSGIISAAASTTSPQFVTSLTAYAIYDASGSLSSITNTGTITATATALANNGQLAVAADLAVNQKGVNFQNMGAVTGNIYFGTGADVLNIAGTAQQAANVVGNISFGGNSSCNANTHLCTVTGGQTYACLTADCNDQLTIGNFGTVTGAVTEALGNRVDVFIDSGGTLNLQNTPLNLGNNVTGLYAGTFDVATGAKLGLVLSNSFNLAVNPQTGALIQAQNASIGDDTPFAISFGSYIGNFIPGQGVVGANTTTKFDLLSTPDGQLAISAAELASINTSFRTSLPFLFTGNLCTWNVNGTSTCSGSNPGNSEIVLNLTPKTTQQLGLTGYALKMFPYANESLVYDDQLGAAMLNGITNAQQAQAAYAAFAPDVSGAERALAVSLTDDATNVVAARQRALRQYANQDGDLTMWTQEFVERLNQDNTVDGSGFTDSGFGFVLGADEGDPADGRYGGAFTFFSGGMSAKAPLLQKTNSEWYMLTGYTDWHGRVFFLDTQASVGYANFTGSRTLDLESGFRRTALETHPGEYMAGGATAGLQYNIYGAQLMPQISLDGMAMRQEGYTEKTAGAVESGTDGFDLHVEPNYAASARMFAGFDTREDINIGDMLLQPEARAGYRYDFANGQEQVTANFVDVTPIDQFKISGPKPDKGNAVAGGGIGLSTGAWSLGLSFDYLYANSGNTSEEGTLTLIGRI